MLVLEIFNFDTKETLIGSAVCTLIKLKNQLNQAIDTFVDGIHTGALCLLSFSYSQKHSFIDYIHSGIESAPLYAIDFSEAEGHTDQNISNNRYTKTIGSINNILQYYSTDPWFPVLGTGGNFQGISSPSNCFALTGNIFQSEMLTLAMLEEYYKNTINTITPSLITVYGEILENIIKYIQYEINDSHKFYVLFIMSAGDPSDIQNIMNLLEDAIELPLCIIIMQISNDLIQYGNMENLKKFNDSSRRKIINVCNIDDISTCLEYIEEQMIEYALFKNIEPQTRINQRRISRSSSLKLSPEKIKSRDNYFTQAKINCIELLKKNNFPFTEIEEVSLLGVPFIVSENNLKLGLPQRNRNKIVKQITLRSQDITCKNCKKIVAQLEESKCGCKNFCIDCVKIFECQSCPNALV